MTTLTLSSSSLGMYSRCPAAYRMYKVLNRRPVRSASGLIAGTAIHSALRVLQNGGDVLKQEEALVAVLTETPIVPSEKEYRTAPYLKDALAAFRAEHASTFAGWVIDEVERQGTVKLGYTQPQTGAHFGHTVEVYWEFRRDLVGVDTHGRRWIVDWKSASRDEDAQVKAMANSGQFMGYIASWQIEYPDKPVAGVQPVRIIMRKPTKSGVAYSFPKDGQLYFEQERVDEWRRHTLRKARELLERDPQDADAWPMATTELGCCRHTFGCCEYIDVCLLKPAERPLKLSLDEFEDAEAAKLRERNATNEGES